jgi:hypothetical protein
LPKKKSSLELTWSTAKRKILEDINSAMEEWSRHGQEEEVENSRKAKLKADAQGKDIRDAFSSRMIKKEKGFGG